MYEEKVIYSAAVLLMAGAWVAHAQGFIDWNFRAPSINGKTNIDPETAGDIAYDTSDSSFWGYTGGGWVQLGSATIPNLNFGNPTPGSNYSVANTDDIVIMSGSSVNVTLPDADALEGKAIQINHSGTSLTQVYTLLTDGDTIGGVASGSYALYTKGEKLKVVSDGDNWLILSHETATDWVNAGNIGITGTTSNPSKGTVATDNIWWRRVGANVEIRIEYKQTGAGSAGSGDYLFATPTGISIDTSKVSAYTTVIGWAAQINALNSVGSTFLSSSGGSAANSAGSVFVYDSTHVRFGEVSSTTATVAGTGMLSSGSNRALNGVTVTYAATFSVPVSGWQP